MADDTDLRADLAAALEQLLGGDEDAALDRRTGRARLNVQVREDHLAGTRTTTEARRRVEVRKDGDYPPIRRFSRPESIAELLRTELPNGGLWSALWLGLRELATLSLIGWVTLIALSVWQPTTQLEIGGGLVPIWQVALGCTLILRSLMALLIWGARAVTPSS